VVSLADEKRIGNCAPQRACAFAPDRMNKRLAGMDITPAVELNALLVWHAGLTGTRICAAARGARALIRAGAAARAVRGIVVVFVAGAAFRVIVGSAACQQTCNRQCE
jgi:hypothetical protein